MLSVSIPLKSTLDEAQANHLDEQTEEKIGRELREGTVPDRIGDSVTRAGAWKGW